MKILIAELGDAVQAQGGIEKVVSNMANAMADRGHDVTVMIFDRRQGELFYHLSDKVKFLNPGAGVHIDRTWVNIANLFCGDRDLKEYRRHEVVCRKMAEIIKPLLEQIKPDIIVSHEYKSVRIFKGIIETKVPVISFFHLDPQNWLENKYFRPAFEKVECINVLLPGYIDELKKMITTKKVVSIPNVVPQYERVCNYDSKVIINVARIDYKQKRQKMLIDAFAKIAECFPEWKVEFFGDVNFDKAYYQELLRIVRQYGLGDRILFCGSTKKVAEKLSHASIFAFPSVYEGFSLALTEAMSMGLPVIGCKSCSAVNEIIKNGENGVLTGDGADGFAEGLRKLMESEKLRQQLGQRGKEDMKEYSEEVVWNKWEKLIKELG